MSIVVFCPFMSISAAHVSIEGALYPVYPNAKKREIRVHIKYSDAFAGSSYAFPFTLPLTFTLAFSFALGAIEPAGILSPPNTSAHTPIIPAAPKAYATSRPAHQ